MRKRLLKQLIYGGFKESYTLLNNEKEIFSCVISLIF